MGVVYILGVKLPFRLFTFLPGLLTIKSGYTPKLMYQIGELLARFHIATEVGTVF